MVRSYAIPGRSEAIATPWRGDVAGPTLGVDVVNQVMRGSEDGAD